MKIVCAWCKKDMGEKPPYEDKSVTHSICPECKAKHFPGEEKPIVSEAEAFQKRLEYELKKEGFTREPSTHPLILEQYPIGKVPKEIPIGGLDVPVPPLRGTELPPKKPKNIPENTAIRTSEKFDNAVKHLGYESVSFSQEELDELGKTIPTDIDIIKSSQKRLRETEVVPDEKLDPKQLPHLKLARAITKEAFPFSPPAGVYAAIIPPASDRVRTAGIYGTTTEAVYIGLDQLYGGRTTVDTLVHELGHHREYRQTGFAEDLSQAHAEAMTDVAAGVVEDVAKGTFDELLKEVSW